MHLQIPCCTHYVHETFALVSGDLTRRQQGRRLQEELVYLQYIFPKAEVIRFTHEQVPKE